MLQTEKPAVAVIDRALALGPRIDFVEEIAKQLPMRMLGALLGVPESDGPWLVEKGDALLGNTDPDFTTHPVGLVDTDEFRLMPFRSPAGFELFRYAQEQAAMRRAAPTDDVISVLFTATDDIHSVFPATAARGIGLGDVPLICARELEIEGSMPRVVRMMAHVETDLPKSDITHVYLHGAARLRRDLTRVREVNDDA